MISLTIPAPVKPLNSNERLHHHEKARRTREWRDTAGIIGARSDAWLSRAHVTVTVHATSNRRRDVGNFYPTAKAVLDGIVDAGLLPDDSDRYVVGPDMRPGPKAAVFTLTVTLDPDCTCRDCAERWAA